LNSYVEAAVKALEMFPESEAKDSLIELAHFTADRIM
jgi:geranylgeranyl pyrophosphate synthase